MSRRRKTTLDPQALERIRAVRAAEDSAISEVFKHVGLVEAAKAGERRRCERTPTSAAPKRRVATVDELDIAPASYGASV